jgi:uncharacterized membrane protein YgaE (UPF0421/DUF939 family)
MKLGARIFKTGIAITLALWIAELIGIPNPLLAGIVAIFAIQPTIYRSFLTIIDQLQGNVIGAVLATTFGLLFGPNPLVIGFTALIVITLNLKLKIDHTIPITLVTVIAILESPGDNFLYYAFLRTSTVALGVLCAFVVNFLFFPPKYETKLVRRTVESTEEIIKWIRHLTNHSTMHSVLKEDIERLKEKMVDLEQLFLRYKEERSYSKRSAFIKSRKLVLFRHSISTSNRALDLLQKVHRLENDIDDLPEDLKRTFIKEIDDLLLIHERILLSLTGKIKTPKTKQIIEESLLLKKEKIVSFLNHRKNPNDDTINDSLMLVIASVVDYREHLEHMDTLLSSYQNYHTTNSELKV